MNNVLEDSLFVSQTKKFDEIQSIVRQFSAEYVGNSIIKDNIFAVIQNYARKKEIALELLRYPIHDDELWALTFLKQDTIFVCVNTALPLCKQFFAAAHELYHKALIFKKSDVEDLREKLQDACDHPEMVMKMKNQAADFICAKYNWDEVVKETMKLYRRK